MFAQPWWLDAMSPDWEVALSYNGEELAGAWPRFPTRKWGVKFWRNPPLTPYLGPQFYFPNGLKGHNRERFTARVTEELLAQFGPLPPVCNVGLEPAFKGAGILKRSGFEVAARQTFLLSLAAGPDALVKGTNENIRRRLRLAANALRIAEAPELIHTLWAGQQETLQRKGAGGTAHNKATLERAVAASVAQGQGMLWAAYEGEQVAALLWSVWDAEQAYCLASTQLAGSHQAAVTALIWHAIEAACRRGNTIFDFEGSMDAGIEHFFRGFGGQLETYLVARRDKSLLFKARGLLRK